VYGFSDRLTYTKTFLYSLNIPNQHYYFLILCFSLLEEQLLVPGPLDNLRPSFLPSAFFTSGTGLWDGRYISSFEDNGCFFAKSGRSHDLEFSAMEVRSANFFCNSSATSFCCA
jgi:hypothetical protein